MPKFTLYAVLQLLRLVISFIDKSVRLIYAIIDVVDDGVKNNSAVIPDWMGTVQSVLSSLVTSGNLLRSVSEDNSEFGE